MAGETVLIMVVEDSLRMVLADSLARLGYDILEATTGRDAYVLASRCVPNLVLLDLELPDGDGFWVVRALRDRPETACIPVAVLTEEALSGPRAADLMEHCIGYLPKSVGPDRLVRDVAVFLRKGFPCPKPAAALGGIDDFPRRRYPRFSVRLRAVCRFPGSERHNRNTSAEGLVRTLSEGGLMLEFLRSLGKGTLVEVGLRIIGTRLQPVAEVVWTGPRETGHQTGPTYRHGLRFVRIARGQREAIRRFLFKRFTP